jgi:hypothetical protein
MELKKPMWGWGNSAVLWWNLGIALLWRNRKQAETDSLTKRKAHFQLTGLPCVWKGLVTAHLPAPHRTTFENLPTPEVPTN